MAIGEFEMIERYFGPLSGEGALGLVDDAARLTPPPGRDLVVTVDTVACGVHFLRDDPAETVARKALRVNLSDIAAKGAEPIGYLLSAALPAPFDEAWIAAFAEGLASDQREFSFPLLGGDTIAHQDGPILSVTAFGSVPSGRMVLRSGGSPGDLLYVTGGLGGAAVGLALRRGAPGPWTELSAEARWALVRRYRVPEPRTGLAEVLRDHASAAMDISDGLVGDCDKLAAASGLSGEINADRVPVDPALAVIASDEPVSVRILTGGDDYEILAAVGPDRASAFEACAGRAGVAVTRIGELIPGRDPVRVTRNGRPLDLAGRAFVHTAMSGREANTQ